MYLLYYDDTDAVLCWRCDKQGQFSGSAELNTLGGRSLTVLLAAPLVTLREMSLPVRQRSRLLQALPYALEENLAQEVEELHFAAGERDRDGILPVAVVARTVMDALQERLTSCGATALRIFPDLLAVPHQAETWSILFHAGRALVRYSPSQGFAVEQTDLSAWLALLWEEHTAVPPRRVVFYLDEHQTLPALPWAVLLPGVEQAVERHPQGTAGWLCRGLEQTPRALNLGQGAYRPAATRPAWWRPWRLSAALVLLWLLLQGALMGFEAQRLEAERNELNAQMHQLYRDTFPDTRRVVSPRVQMERALAKLDKQPAQAGADAFLSHLQKFGTAFGEVSGLTLKRLDYRGGRLELALELPTLQALEQFKQALRKQDWEVEIRSASSEHGKVDARLRLAAEESKP